MHARSPIPLVALALAGCAASPDSTARATGTAEALDLAARVQAHAGGADAMKAVRRIAFSFQDRRHVDWDLERGIVRIVDLSGETPWRLLEYDVHTDSAVVAPRAAVEDPVQAAKSIWVNDTYWLLVTLKVLDPGVRLSIDPPAEGDHDDVARLRMRFEDVGLTPQNEYVLHVRESDGQVLRWDYFETADAEPRSFAFEAHGHYGPLYLSTWRPRLGGEGGIRIGDLRIE